MKLIGWLFVALLIFTVVSAGGYALGWLGRAADVVSHEIDPAVLQQKYEWFKNASATLDAKKADIAVYENRFSAIGGSVGRCPQGVNRTTQEQCLVWVQEVSGIIASYNALASEYNAEMAKWNWRFTNVGMLPQGATEPLPREFKPYQYQ